MRLQRLTRMGGRAVEGTGLENRQACKGLVGSNPTPSAMLVFGLYTIDALALVSANYDHG